MLLCSSTIFGLLETRSSLKMLGFETASIITSASLTLADYKDSNGWPESPSPSLTGIKLKKPMRSWRVYFDGAVSFRGNCLGLGVWLQSPLDDFVVGISAKVSHSANVELAEFMALRLAICTAKERGLSEFTVVGDALGVIQSLVDPALCPGFAQGILEDILSGIDSFVKITPCWIGRAHNSVSHELAFHAKNMDCNSRSWTDVPPFIVAISAGCF